MNQARKTADLIPVHALFAEQARVRPEAVALSFEDRLLSYGEVGREVERLACRLRARGVGPEVLVAIAVERSPEMVIAVLAVLAAGGAYVPLDAAYPADRLRFMLEDAGAGLILTTRALAARLPEVPGAVRLLLDEADQGAAGGAHGPAAPPDLDHLAYVMYTSGSTGRPKGVAVPHRGLANLLPQIAERMAVSPGSRVLQLASLSFDASVLEIFLATTRGASLHLVARSTLLSGEALAAVLRERAITTLAIPPSLLSTLPDGAYPDLAAIVLGGEAPSAEIVRRFQAGRILLNAYAPTEATILITAEPCDRASDEPPALGEALAGGEMLLLERGAAVADGAAGEIHLGGTALARGYHRRPALTAERFVPHPKPASAGSRLYKSGDLARRRPRRDGAGSALFFAGRADSQVKLRGVRIELGEIEAVLRRHGAVREAVAAVRRELGDERLVAYFVPAAEAPPASAEELRAFVSRALPAAMVPGLFVPLAALPVTATGKVDRDALPHPGRQRPALATPYRAPRGETEAALARIARELLGLDEIGADDSLFELGGHSLLMTRLAARVRAELGAEVALLDLFERPTIAALAQALTQALAAAAPRALPPLRPGERTSPIPLTYPQERIWFLNQLAPAAISYAFQFTLRLTGVLSPRVLADALSEIIRRHEVLRTGFPAADGRPVQEIHPPFRAALPLLDLSALPAERRAAQAEGLVARGVRRPINAARPPLLLWTLFRLGPEAHLLLQVEHHFVHDGWSLAVFLRELRELYLAGREGRPSPLPEPAIQYADFACWQRRTLAGAELAAELAFWRAEIADTPLVLELPADRPRPKVQSFRGGVVRDELPRPLYDELRAFSRRHGVTLFTTMLAAFAALLSRLSGRSRFLIGSGVANRRLAETEGMLGMVVNTVVLPTDLSGNPAFSEALARTRKAVLTAHAHQDLPFEKLVEELAPARDLSHNPLAQVMFSFHDAAVPELDLPGLEIELLERHNGSAKVDLNVVVKPLAEQRVGQGGALDGDLTMVWEYATDLFDRATVERLWRRYEGLLAAILATPGARLSALPLLSAAERAELESWGKGAAAAGFRSLPAAVCEAVAADAESTAVASCDRLLTYGELWRQASTLARTLSAEGAGPERVVAILFERSPERVVAELAALLAGAAYLPIDPAYPAERIRFMLADARAALLLGRRRLAAALGETEVPMLLLADGESWPEEGDLGAGPDLGGEAAPEQTAYLIYTSGSSGQPKGVMVTHRGLANLVAWHVETYGIRPADRASQVAGLGFDASVWETWPVLAAGASLHLAPEPVRSAPIALLDWLAAEQITRAFLPTPLAEGVLAELADGRRSWPHLALTTLLTGGDRLHRPPGGALHFELVNHYGPTEAAVVATAAEILGREEAPPIGRPIRGFTIAVVGPYLTQQPPGVPGQLLLGGAGLARGYHQRPALTAERFLPHPWAAAGERAYATGDLVRLRPDGQLDFLGRLDSQVKIRGFRIELGEIEAELRRHPSIAEAVVVARPPASGAGRELWGYAVPRAGATCNVEDVRRHLERRLPGYMVPAALTLLAVLPQTANGKVDLRALPDVAPGAEGQPTYVAPRNETEEFVAGLWADLLRLERVGVHDHFFRLGGHSLIATRLLARIHDLAGVELPLAVLFETPTVEGLALAIEDRLIAELADGEEAAAFASSRDT